MLPDPISPEATTHEVAIIPMNFRIDYRPVPGKPGEFREVEKVDLVKKGSNGQSTPHTIKELRENPMLWPVIKARYEAWKEGQAEPVDGTPLDVWPAVHKGQVDQLRLIHIRTVEDVAGLTDGDLERVGMGARALRDKARDFIEAKKGSAAIIEAKNQLEGENAQLRAELDELREMVNELSANQRKKPGPRPRGDAE